MPRAKGQDQAIRVAQKTPYRRKPQITITFVPRNDRQWSKVNRQRSKVNRQRRKVLYVKKASYC